MLPGGAGVEGGAVRRLHGEESPFKAYAPLPELKERKSPEAVRPPLNV